MTRCWIIGLFICVASLGCLVCDAAASPPEYYVNATGWWNETGHFNPAPTNPIQAALTNASAGSVVTVVEQTSYPASLVFDTKSITLDFNGSRLDGTGFSDTPGITLANTAGVIIKNGEITSFQDGILFRGSSDGVSVSGMTIATSGRNGIWFEGDCRNTVFSNVTITDPAQAGITKAQRAANLENLTYQDCTVTGAGSNGIELDDYSSSYYGTYHVRDIVFANVTVRNATANGIIIGQESTPLSGNVTVRDCTVEGAGQNGVRVLGRGEAVIDGVQSRGNGDAGGDGTYYGLSLKGIEAPSVTLLNLTVGNNRNGLFLEEVADIVLDDRVTVRDNGGYAYALQTCDNLTVRDDTFTPAVRSYLRGMSLTAVTNSTFENITITEPDANGIWFEGDCRNTVFSNVTITDPAQAGITKEQRAANLENITIQDCTITGAGADGIALDDYSSSYYGTYHVRDIVLSNVIVRNATANGIIIGQESTPLSRNVTVRDCTAEGAGKQGMQILGRGEAVIDGVQSRGNGDAGGDGAYYGLYLKGTEAPSVTVLNTTAENNRNGLYLEGVSDIVLDGGVAVRDNGGYVYLLKTCDNITLRDHAFNPTVRPYLRGLYISSVTNSTFENITLSGATGDAVVFEGTSAGLALEAINITAPAKNGIYFNGNCENSVFSNLTVTDPAQAGITKYYRTGDLDNITFQDCTVTGSGGDGVALDDSSYYGTHYVQDIVLANVTVRNATSNGILVGQDTDTRSTNITLRDCTVEGAGKQGIQILGRGEAVIDGVETRGNGDAGGDGSYYGFSFKGIEAPNVTLLDLTVGNNRNGLYLENVADLSLGTEVAAQGNGGFAYTLKTCDNITVRDHAFNSTVRPYLRGLTLSSVTNSTFENITISGNTGDAIVFEGTSDGLALDAINITAPAKNGIWLNGNCANTVFSNLTIVDAGQAGVTKYYQTGNLDALTFQDCTVTGTGGDGIALDDSSYYGTHYVSNIVLANVTVRNATGNGILVGQDTDARSTNIILRDCTVEGAGYNGFRVLGRGEVVIDGVQAGGNGDRSGDGTYYGLYLKGIGEANVTLLNLTVENNRNGFYLEEISDLILDEEVAVRGNGGFAYTLRTCDNITVRNRALDSTGRPYLRGLYISSVTNSTFENITLSDATGDAVVFEGTSTGLVLDTINITKTGTNGIYFNGNCANTVFSNVVITKSGQAGILKYYRAGDLDNITFQDCTVTGSGGDGVALDDSYYYGNHYVRDIVLANVTVRNATGNGILLGQDTDTRSTNLTLRDCTVEGAGYNGVRVIGRGEVVFDGIQAGGNGDRSGDGSYYGLYLRGIEAPNVTLLNLTVENNRNGLYLESVADLSLGTEVVAQGNGGFVYTLRTCDNITVQDQVYDPTVRPYLRGLYISSVTNSTFENITLSGATGDAVVFEGTSAGLALDAVTITTPGQNGIYFNGNCENTAFSNITITEPAQAGITKYSRYSSLANLTFRDCTVTGARGNGIALDDYSSYYVRDIVLSNVTVSNATGSGIIIGEESTAQSRNIDLSGCTVSSSGQNGLDLRVRGDLKVSDCEATGNAQTGMILIGIENLTVAFENTTVTGNNRAMQVTGITATINNSALAGTTADLSLAGSANITLSNTTHDRTKVNLDATSRLTVLWPLTIRTVDRWGSPVAGADVTATDVNGTAALSVKTGADGLTGPHPLTAYARNGTAPAVFSTPYTLTATSPTSGSASDTTDLTRPTNMTLRLILDTEPPAITFVAPTPTDGARSPANVTVRTLVTDDIGVAGALLEVNGVNATMTLDRAGTTVYALGNITGDGISRYRVYARDPAGNVNVTPFRSVGISTTPPPGVSGLNATTVSETGITWTWTDPADPTFDHVMLFFNGTFSTNVSAGVETYTATGLAPDTAYLLGTRTVDFCGQANATWVNATTRTAPDRTPPASVTGLNATAVSETAITWTWTDPTDADFASVQVSFGNTTTSVPAGEEHFNATGLAPDTEYRIGTHTVDTAGNVNQTWVNATARTAPAPVTPTPAPISSTSGSGSSSSRASAASAGGLSPGQQGSLNFKGAVIYAIDLTAADTIPELLFTVEDIGSLPADIPAPDTEIYRIEGVEQYRTNDSDIASATIRFSVSKTWIEERGYRFSDIVLLRFHEGAWTELPTTFEGEKDGYYYYSASSPGLSYFAVVYHQNGTIVPEVTAPAREAAASTATQPETTSIPTSGETTPIQSPSVAFGILGTLLAMAAAGGAVRRRKR